MGGLTVNVEEGRISEEVVMAPLRPNKLAQASGFFPEMPVSNLGRDIDCLD
jgi:hypothetical protein